MFLCGKFPFVGVSLRGKVVVVGSMPLSLCMWEVSLCEKFPLLKKYVLDASKLIDKEIIFF